MGKKVKRFLLVLCVPVLCISVMGIAAFAAPAVTASIPVSITLSGTEPAVPEAFVVEVTAADPTYPMPTGSDHGIYRMVMQGRSSEAIDIPFDKLGVYDYSVRQVAGANGDCRYDDAVYYVTVFVTNSQTGPGCDWSVAVYRDGETVKREKVVFENVYINAAKTDSPQTGDGSEIRLWITLMALSFAGIAALVILRHKIRNIS